MDDFEWRPDFQLYYSASRNSWATWDSDRNAWLDVNTSSPAGVAYDGESEDSDGRESGEVSDEEANATVDPSYNPEYEWPCDEPELDDRFTNAPSTTATAVDNSSRPPPDLRLIVVSSGVLSSKRKFAVVRASEGASIGRDSAPGSCLRLKEMAVSKFHANIFWDHERLEWAVADVGSMHGTYVLSAATSSSPVRLSPARAASPPRGLKHMDVLTIGSTSFLIHIHQDDLPCQDCFFPETNRISLDNAKKSKQAVQSGSGLPLSANDKKAAFRMDISNLRNSLLSRTPSAPPLRSDARYVDRSARRRLLFPYSDPSTRRSSPKPSAPSAVPSTSSSRTPIPSSNIGHALLLKQGWMPGMTLGTSTSQALVEPLAAVGTAGRAGLGSKQTVDVDDTKQPLGWREEGRQRRYTSLKESR